MPVELPIYLIVGRQPVSWEHTEDGGSILLGWDFELKEMTMQAASWDDVIGLTPNVPVAFQGNFAEGDTEQVTKKQFDAALRKLQGEPPA